MAQSLRYQAVKQGGPMELATVPRPSVERGNDVLIKIKAVALQPLDWKMIDYGIMVKEWPAAFGSDGAGVVEEIGGDVKTLKPGDDVFGVFLNGSQRSATHQEYAVANQFALAKKPKSLSFEDAANLPVGYLSGAAVMSIGLGMSLPFLVPYGGPTEGFQPKSVLVLGGSSSVGATTIQLLRVALPDVLILTTSSEKHHTHLKALGADKAFDRSASADDIRAVTPGGKGVDGIIDTVNGVATQLSLFETFDPAGPKHFAELATGANVEKVPQGIKHSLVRSMELLGKPEGRGLMQSLVDLLASGQFKIPVPTKVVGEGLEAIGKGLDELRAGVSGTKLVVKV